MNTETALSFFAVTVGAVVFTVTIWLVIKHRYGLEADFFGKGRFKMTPPKPAARATRPPKPERDLDEAQTP